MTKSKPVAPKPVLAWCVAVAGELLPEFTFAEDCWDAHCEMELARTALHGPKES